MSHSTYNLSRPPVRNKMGFQDFIILQPGDYQLHWNLKTHRYETFTKDDESFCRIISGDCDANYGIMAAIMYPQAQPLGVAMSSAPYYKETDSSGCIYYAGRAADFVTPYYDRPAFQENVQFINEHIIQYVVPYRSTTLNVGWLTITGANSFFLTDGQEENTLIFHIGDKAPFPQFQFQAQNNEAWFRKTGDYFSPAIYIYATQNLGLNDVAIVTGKIWLERIGDYTDNQDGWEKEILSVPSGWVIR